MPIHCHLCPPSITGQPRTIWKYNTLQHIVFEHMVRDNEGNHLPSIPPEMVVNMYISRAEDKALEVEEELTEG